MNPGIHAERNSSNKTAQQVVSLLFAPFFCGEAPFLIQSKKQVPDYYKK